MDGVFVECMYVCIACDSTVVQVQMYDIMIGPNNKLCRK